MTQPRPTFDTWADWARFHYEYATMTLDEFLGYLDRPRAFTKWSALLDDVGIDFAFEHEVELRAVKAGVY